MPIINMSMVNTKTQRTVDPYSASDCNHGLMIFVEQWISYKKYISDK